MIGRIALTNLRRFEADGATLWPDRSAVTGVNSTRESANKGFTGPPSALRAGMRIPFTGGPRLATNRVAIAEATKRA